MRLYRASAQSDDILRYGRRLKKGVMRYAATRALGDTLDGPQAALQEAAAARVALQAPLDDASDDLKFAELDAESKIRRVYSRCRELDGDREGPISQLGFPNGLTVLLVPKGANQKAAFEKLRGAFQNSNLAELAPHKDSLVALCDEALALFVPAFEAWDAAKDRYNQAFAVETQRRSEHRRTVDAIFGGIRQALPRDRRLQDAIVPQGEGNGRRRNDADDETEDDDEPMNDETPTA